MHIIYTPFPCFSGVPRVQINSSQTKKQSLLAYFHLPQAVSGFLVCIYVWVWLMWCYYQELAFSYSAKKRPDSFTFVCHLLLNNHALEPVWYSLRPRGKISVNRLEPIWTARAWVLQSLHGPTTYSVTWIRASRRFVSAISMIRRSQNMLL